MVLRQSLIDYRTWPPERNEGDHDRLNEVEAGRIELPSEIESQ